MQSEDPEILREAAFRAGEEDCLEAIPQLSRLLVFGNIGVQEAAELTLRKLGGKQTIEALLPLLWSEDPPVRNVTMDILRDICSHDIDALAELLREDDSDIRIFAADILGYANSIMAVRPLCEALLRDLEINVRYQAAVSLGQLGHHEAAKCLNQSLNDDEWVQFASIEALKKIKDASSVDALLQVLDSASDLVAVVIIETLGDMAHIKAVPKLLHKMDSCSQPLQSKIVQALVSILGNNAFSLLNSAEQQRLYPALLAALEDEDPDVQDAAVMGLKFLGAQEASDSIFKLLLDIDRDREPERFEAVVDTLQVLGLNQELRRAVLSSDPVVSSLAIRVLNGIDDPESRELLRSIFWDRDRDEQRAISKSLSLVPDQSSIAFFQQLLESHEDGSIIKNGIAFLGQTMKVQEAAEMVLGFLEHPYDDVKERALECCIALDTDLIRERFRDMLTMDSPVQRFMAVYALGQLMDQPSLPAFRRALQDTEADVRKVALEALFCLSGDEEETLLDMLPALEDENPEVRKILVGLLGNSTLPEVEEHLRQALTDVDEWVCIRALDSLEQRSCLSDGDVDHLMTLFARGQTILKLKIIDILGNLGGKASFKALFTILENEDWDVQEAADRALAQLKTA